MELLVLGIVLWSAVHLSPRLAPGVKASLVERIGAQPYRGVFSLLLIAALVCMVFGWRSITPEYLYQPPPWARPVNSAMMLVAAILFISARGPSDIRLRLRHPQLMSVIIFALAHLLVNGDSRSMVLFFGLALWAVFEVLAIDYRETRWERPEEFGSKSTAIVASVGGVLWLVLMFIHPWLSGVPLWGAW